MHLTILAIALAKEEDTTTASLENVCKLGPNSRTNVSIWFKYDAKLCLVGLSFLEQKLDQVPMEAHDIQLDSVIISGTDEPQIVGPNPCK